MKKFLLLLFSLTLIFTSACDSVTEDRPFEITFLSIGKADCTVIQVKDKCILIDTGEEENLPEVLAFLQKKGIRKIDTLIFSHFDKDHVGGAAGILQSLTVKNILESPFSSDREEYRKYKAECEKQNIKATVLTEVYEFTVADYAFTVIPPEKDRYDRKEDNNSSMIVTMKHGGSLFGFFGDAMDERLEEYMASYSDRFDLIKLPYHGNYLEQYPSFLDQTSPAYAVATCSLKNPADEKTLSLLEEKGVDYYLTANGEVSVIGTKDGFTIKQTNA